MSEKNNNQPKKESLLSANGSGMSQIYPPLRTSNSRIQSLLGRKSSESSKGRLSVESPGLSQTSSTKLQQNSAKQTAISFSKGSIGFQKPPPMETPETKGLGKREIPGSLKPSLSGGSANLISKFNSTTAHQQKRPLLIESTPQSLKAPAQIQKSSFLQKREQSEDSSSLEIVFDKEDLTLTPRFDDKPSAAKSDSSDRQLLFGSKKAPDIEIEHHIEFHDDANQIIDLDPDDEVVFKTTDPRAAPQQGRSVREYLMGGTVPFSTSPRGDYGYGNMMTVRSGEHRSQQSQLNQQRLQETKRILHQGFNEDNEAFDYDNFKSTSPTKQFGLTPSALQARTQQQVQKAPYQSQANYYREQQQQQIKQQAQQQSPWGSNQLTAAKPSFYQQNHEAKKNFFQQRPGANNLKNKALNLVNDGSNRAFGNIAYPGQNRQRESDTERLLSQYRTVKQVTPEEISDDDDHPLKSKIVQNRPNFKVSQSPATDSLYNRIIDQQQQFKTYQQRQQSPPMEKGSLLQRPEISTLKQPLSKYEQDKNAAKIREQVHKKLNITPAGTSLASKASDSNRYTLKNSKKHFANTISAQQFQDEDAEKERVLRSISKRSKEVFQQKPAITQASTTEADEAKAAEKKKKEDELKRKQNQSFLSEVLGLEQAPTVQTAAPATIQKSNDFDESMKDWISQIQQTANHTATTEEQRQRYDESVRKHFQDEARKQREEQLRKFRFNNRKTVDELIKPILNLNLIEMFKGEDKAMFDRIPANFESFEQYRETWIPVFLYETYNQLINQKTDGERDRELLEAQGIKVHKETSQKMHFEGLIQRHTDNREYIEVKLYQCARSDPDRFGNYQLSILDQIKDFDLLLLTFEPLPTNEVKKLTNADYLLQIKKEKGKILTVVTARRKRDQNYIILKLDRELHNDFMMVKCVNLDFLKMHVYYFDSLITTVREFRTIKSCEFFPTAQIILQPSIINELGAGEDTDPQRKKIMEQFINGQRNHFNEVQLQALEHVAKMKKEDFLLIQGPPGTGKTHTIQGIITMLVQSNVRRILICAPSNAAIDEIVMRIATYRLFGTLSEAQLKSKLLRLGSMDYDPLPNVKNYTLDAKIKVIMDDDGSFANGGKKTNSVSQQIENKLSYVTEKTQYISTMRRIIKNDLEEKEKGRLSEISASFFGRNQEGLEKLKKFYKMSKDTRLKELEALDQQYKKLREDLEKEDKQYERGREKPKLKRSEVEKQIIQEAQIICTTLSMSASEKLDLIDSIEYLIVDEACQCVELNNLIPFEHDPKKVILVGDHQQLPATTFSENSDVTCYSRSLFERCLENEVKRFMLSIQYRMHPMIRQFPSDQFYEGSLLDAPSVSSERARQSSFVVRSLEQSVSNLIFFDLKYAQEQASEMSKTNMDEAAFIEALFNEVVNLLLQSQELPPHFRSHREKMDFLGKELKGKIGIISPYKQQVRTLKNALYPKLRSLNLPNDVIEINTVDAYQGREKDIIIISCVRGSQSRTLGFLNDYRRMNVAITRAKNFLWVVGNSRTLSKNEHWGGFIQYSKVCSGNSPRSDETQRSYICMNEKKDWADNNRLLNILSNNRNHTPTMPNLQTPREEGEIVTPPRNRPLEGQKRDYPEKRDHQAVPQNKHAEKGQDLRKIIDHQKKRDIKRDEKRKDPLSFLMDDIPKQQLKQTVDNRGGSSSSTDANSIKSPTKAPEIPKKVQETQEKNETTLLFENMFSKF